MKKLLLPGLLIWGFASALPAEEASPVRSVFPAKAKAEVAYQVPGRTEAVETATIFTRATGIIRERRFEIGSSVKTGDVLAVVDAPEIDREVEAARARVEQNKARAENASSLAARSDRLLKSDAISAEESDQRRTTANEMNAGLRVAEADLARLEEQQRFATVKAPFDGVISARNFERGDHVRGDDAAAEGWLYRLSRMDRLKFVISAPPDLALRLAKEQEAEVSFTEFPGKKFPAKVAHSSRVFESANGTMRVELLLENKDLLLPSGLTGAVRFKLAPAASTYLVPGNALVLRQGKPLLAVIEGDRVKYLEVQPGRNLGRDVEVMSGALTETTPVILNPNAMLREGDAVRSTPVTASK